MHLHFALVVGLTTFLACSKDDTGSDDQSAQTGADDDEVVEEGGDLGGAPSEGARGDGAVSSRDSAAATNLDAATMRDASTTTPSAEHDGAIDAQSSEADAGPAVEYDWAAGDYPPDLMGQTYLTVAVPGQSAMMRQFKVHVPKSYDKRVPTPVVYAIHGLGQNAVMFVVQGTGWVAKSDAEGFLLVMPNGLQEGIGGSWNAGVCCGPASEKKLEDVATIRAIHAEIAKHLNVDARRVYASGLSNGGFLSYRLACEAADLFTAIAPVAGAIGTPTIDAVPLNPMTEFTKCEPSRPVAVLAIHGDADSLVPYRAMAPSLAHFAQHNGCDATTEPATQPTSGGDTKCVTYPGCEGGVEVTGCSVAAGGHCWFGDATCGTGAPGIGPLIVGRNSDHLKATDAAWDFLKRFSR